MPTGVVNEAYQQVCSRIQQAKTTSELLQIHDEMPRYIQICFLQTKEPGAVTCQKISDWHDQMIQKVIADVQCTIQAEIGCDLPSYSWVLFGSWARQETTFYTDQDNGLIYEYPVGSREEEVDTWFEKFANQVVQNLVEVGYPLCDGNVMASNHRWRGSIATWKKQLAEWLDVNSSRTQRLFMIAADMRHVYGQHQLAYELENYMISLVKKEQHFLLNAAHANANLKLPISWWGYWYKERYGAYANHINVKRGGYIQLIGVVKILSFYYAITAKSTRDRLKQIGHLNAQLQDNLDFLLTIRLRQHVYDFEHGKTPTNYILPASLEKNEERLWKKHLKSIRRLQKYAIQIISQKGLEDNGS
ncbi:hypothetical protein IC619_011100 [Hazenella sp. IB182353]|uniref:DUF294 nucleotidyltransferase-like domain-containing protein n=1 Tax=Polycladospora coralii TaxID=2771432 RepID=UPI0017460795|nr:hypothetical protein [Polycladospora coralii]